MKRLFQFLLKIFPREFREDHGREMEQVFRLQSREGRFTRMRIVTEMLRAAPLERWDAFKQDSRAAFRMLRRNPGFTTVAALTIALGIGATAAVFSIVDAVLLKPLPYSHPKDLVQIRAFWRSWGFGSLSIPEYMDLRQNTSFSGVAAFHTASLNFAVGKGEPERVQVCQGTDGMFDLLGVQPLLGRTFVKDDYQPSHNQVVVLSYGLWLRRFGADRSIIGRELRIEGQTYAVVGVMPAGFYFPDKETELWHPPVFTQRELESRGNHSRSVIARIRSDVDPKTAQSELDAVAGRFAQQYPGNYPSGGAYGLRLTPLHEVNLGTSRSTLVLLMIAAGLLLLTACINVANLMLARNTVRHGEMAIRTALGARAGRLRRQLATESLWLAVAGGLIGLFLAFVAVQNIRVFSSTELPQIEEASIDGRTISVTAGLVVIVAIVFGTLPAARLTRKDLNTWIRSGPRSSADHQSTRARSVLVVAEIALATVLLIGAGLTLHSLNELWRVDPGLSTDKVLTARVSLASKYSEPRLRVDFYNRLMEALKRRPAVASVGAISVLPLSGWMEDWAFTVEGYQPPDGPATASEQTRHISGEYFQSLGIPLRSGRLFTDSDGPDSPPVAIVSESFAKKYWKNQDPIGKRVKLLAGNSEVTVVGVVGDIRHLGLQDTPHPFVYYPFAQSPRPTMTLVVRSDLPVSNVAAAIREEVARIDAEQAVYNVQTLNEYASESIGHFRLTSLILTLIGSLALMLGTVGIYGLMAFSTTQRSHEIGLRIALGAERAQIFRQVVGKGLMLAFAGIALGLAGGAAFARMMQTQLFGVTPFDPIAFAFAPLVLAVVAFLASALPALRATRIDPATSLRFE